MLCEISQRKTNTVYYLYMESKIYIPMNVHVKHKQPHRRRKQLVVTKGEWERGGAN